MANSLDITVLAYCYSLLFLQKMEKPLNYLMGIVMKISKGRADPIQAKKILIRLITEEYVFDRLKRNI